MYENYNTCMDIEVRTMIKMVECDIIPACVKDRHPAPRAARRPTDSNGNDQCQQ